MIISSHQSQHKVLNSQWKLVGCWSFLVRSKDPFQSNLFLWCPWELWTICYCQLLRAWLYLIFLLTPTSSVFSFQRQNQHRKKKGVIRIALENSLDSTTEKVHCRQIPLSHPCPHPCWPLLAFPHSLEAGWHGQRGVCSHVGCHHIHIYLKNLLRETLY